MSPKSAVQEGLIVPNADEGPKWVEEKSTGLTVDVGGSLNALSTFGLDNSVPWGCPVS